MRRLRFGWKSITGDFRDNNEDRCLVDPKGRYFLVADGMGGQSAGEKASELAIEIISQKIEESVPFDNGAPDSVSETIDEAVRTANSEIMALSEVDPRFHGMGTTIGFLVASGENLFIGGLGDSRVYLQRGRRFEQLTTDHSIAQALVDAGTISAEDAATHRFRNMLYRYLGCKEGGLGTEIRRLQPQAGDRFLLCTDGVTDGIDEEALDALLRKHDDPQQAADAVVEAARQGGSKDNITCVVVYVE